MTAHHAPAVARPEQRRAVHNAQATSAAGARTCRATATASTASTVTTMADDIAEDDPRVARALAIPDEMSTARTEASARITALAQERSELIRQLRAEHSMTAIAAALHISRQRLYELLESPEQPSPSTSRPKAAGAPKRGNRG